MAAPLYFSAVPDSPCPRQCHWVEDMLRPHRGGQHHRSSGHHHSHKHVHGFKEYIGTILSELESNLVTEHQHEVGRLRREVHLLEGEQNRLQIELGRMRLAQSNSSLQETTLSHPLSPGDHMRITPRTTPRVGCEASKASSTSEGRPLLRSLDETGALIDVQDP